MAKGQPDSDNSTVREGTSLYKVLDKSKEQIRVLYIQPSSDFTAQVHATLHTISLNDPNRSKYNALSYCWAQDSPAKGLESGIPPPTIMLDGVEWIVTI